MGYTFSVLVGREAQKKSKVMACEKGAVMPISTYGCNGKVRAKQNWSVMCFSMFDAWSNEMFPRFYDGYNIVHANWELD
jgi:hypothetical protein